MVRLAEQLMRQTGILREYVMLTVNNCAGDVLVEADDLSYVISNHINGMFIMLTNIVIVSIKLL